MTKLKSQQVAGRKQNIDHPERSLSKPVESKLPVINVTNVNAMTLMLEQFSFKFRKVIGYASTTLHD